MDPGRRQTYQVFFQYGKKNFNKKVITELKISEGHVTADESQMSDSRKYPYHTTESFSEFQEQGGFFELEIQRHGGYLRLEFWRHGGFLDPGFPQETDKSVFLENANFADF